MGSRVPSLHQKLKAIDRKLPEALLMDRMAAHREIGRLRRLMTRKTPEDMQTRIARLERQVAHSLALRQARRDHRPHLHFDPDLPVCERKDDLLAAIRAHQVLIVAGETG
ncbi:MAG: hypothetical protein HKP58_11480, partial [Desulfatitalea sp.]|nr:hypothetical protein [Desulfatitalea sp.]NNK01024.1 hypothetical protein [Desulfatitalea sp.]